MRERSSSAKREQAALSAQLRAKGKTWPEIAAVFRERYRVNARVALRLVHGMSQRDVADTWNERWPDEPRTLKHISYWEQWPSSTGHQPSLVVLGRLAQIYECSVADLSVDCADYRNLDEVYKARQTTPDTTPAVVGGAVVTDQEPAAVLAVPLGRSPSLVGSVNLPLHAAETLIQELHQSDVNEVAKILTMWAERFIPDRDRRQLLFGLSGAFAVAAAAPIFDQLDPDERARIAGVLADPGRLDAATIAHAERMVHVCRREGELLGPQVTLQSVMAERSVLQSILAGGPPDDLLGHMQSVYAELTQLAGWLLFNLGDYQAAQHYYEQARTAAHDAHNVELVTYILCTMSHLATWQGRPRVGIDHAVAAEVWAKKSGSPNALAYASDVAARAYAADSEWDACDEALDNERTALAKIPPRNSVANWWHFYDESFYWGNKGRCAIARGRAREALDTMAQSLGSIDRVNVHDHAMRLSFQSEALIYQGDLDEACRIIGEVVRMTAVHKSRRIDQRIVAVRDDLHRRHRGVRAVTELDETLRLYRGRSLPSERKNKS
ncbi:hypothetical protein [Actinomadura sp. 6N118]|uniref:hypothetical protein n=1 Tax=Actinomadura sp. 6N118 TaxID=3375151 RepID=UPI00379106CF